MYNKAYDFMDDQDIDGCRADIESYFFSLIIIKTSKN